MPDVAIVRTAHVPALGCGRRALRGHGWSRYPMPRVQDVPALQAGAGGVPILQAEHELVLIALRMAQKLPLRVANLKAGVDHHIDPRPGR